MFKLLPKLYPMLRVFWNKALRLSGNMYTKPSCLLEHCSLISCGALISTFDSSRMRDKCERYEKDVLLKVGKVNVVEPNNESRQCCELSAAS